MKFFISKSKKLPRAAQKGLLPREEFMAKGKERFLAAFDASELARTAHGFRAAAAPARPAYVTAFFKIGVGALAVLAVGVGLSAYADTANVAATSPLYPLKRVSENVRLALAPAPEKPQLQATYAVRRANEIAALQGSSPSSTLIPQLTNDMDKDIGASLGAAVNATGSVAIVGPAGTSSVSSSIYGSGRARAHGSRTISNGGAGASATTTATSSATVNTGTIDIYCNAFNVSTSGVLIGHLEGGLSLRPGALAQFNRQCGTDSNNGQDWRTRHSGEEYASGTNDGTGGTITASTTITATTTIMISGRRGENNDGNNSGGVVASGTLNVHTHIPSIGL